MTSSVLNTLKQELRTSPGLIKKLRAFVQQEVTEEQKMLEFITNLHQIERHFNPAEPLMTQVVVSYYAVDQSLPDVRLSHIDFLSFLNALSRELKGK